MAIRHKRIALATAASLIGLAGLAPAGAQGAVDLPATAAGTAPATVDAARAALPRPSSVKAPRVKPAVKAVQQAARPPVAGPATGAAAEAGRVASAGTVAAAERADGGAAELDRAAAPAITAAEHAAPADIDGPHTSSSAADRAPQAMASSVGPGFAAPLLGDALRPASFASLDTIFAGRRDAQPDLAADSAFPKEPAAREAWIAQPLPMPSPDGSDGPSTLPASAGGGSTSLFFSFAALLLAALAIKPPRRGRRLRIGAAGFARPAFASLSERPG